MPYRDVEAVLRSNPEWSNERTTLLWTCWSQNPITATVLPALASYLRRLRFFGFDMNLIWALTQDEVLSSSLHWSA